ncbi:dihydrodipicolinate synthase [Desulfobulbus propionicus DSM 2032]|uniref:4-hydroxy-tetrahydrodipicolinate synthase n=1 Tax=Desulfobulbus propionicus (strain ATCC 33891 / DSM 2032 / VKM B-1956 / 1pr3) TaxID=577650 RepID=A0A7U4DN52_DESPD|nr:4-hydroxy-tetrahydrodipicolinate synthase [Desulfobulbus propionicus]ADW16702.1 dihydrodipicolinate synthase [Desulfobulbus propionicus DSM 2032]
MKRFEGAITALVTPMRNGSIDEQSLIDLIEFQIEGGIHGIVPCGTTGESATLSFDEHKRVIELTVKTVRGRVPVIAGTGANNTLEAIELTESAKNSGADAVLSVVPYYNKPSQEGLYRHFTTILEAVDIPMVLYNVPGRTVTNMLPATVARLATHPNVIGIKEASGNLSQISELLQGCPKDFIVLSGDDFTAMPTVLIGGRGVISVVSNLQPAKMAAMMAAALGGNVTEAKELHYELFSLMGAMFCYPSPAPAKKGLELMGRIASSEVRLPMTEIDATGLERLKQDMRACGLL